MYEVDHAQLARRAAPSRRSGSSRRAPRWPSSTTRDDPAEEIDARLHELRPHDRVHAAAIRVDDRERAEHEHRDAASRARDSVTAGPMISAIGIAVANTRTESASARVTMNTIDVKRRVARPNRCSSSAYAVTSLPS